MPGVQVISHPHPLLSVRQPEHLLDADNTNTQPRPETLAVAAQPGEQGLHRGLDPDHQTPGQARGQPAGAKSSHASRVECEENIWWRSSANSNISTPE